MLSRSNLIDINYVVSTFDCDIYYITVVQDKYGNYLYLDIKYNLDNI